MSYASWHVGMKVVCVDDDISGGFGDETLPTKGGVYTIRTIGIDPVLDSASILLVEIVNPQREYRHLNTGEHLFIEPAFLASYFRPVQKRSTDISILTAILHGARVPEKVEA